MEPKENRPRFDVSVDPGSGRDGSRAVVVKLQWPTIELNVWIAVDEVVRLREIRSRSWERGSLRIGTCCGAGAFWSCDEGEVFLCVGHDDETWDLGLSLPEGDFVRLLSEVDPDLSEE